jgi:transketolase
MEKLHALTPQEILSETDLGKKAAMLQYQAQYLRLTAFDILHEKGTGHWGGASSAAECSPHSIIMS